MAPAPPSSVGAISTTSAAPSTAPSTTVSTATSEAPSVSSQPSGSDVVAVTPVLQSLIDAYDSAVEAILADPRAAGDPTSGQATTFLSLFPEGSEFAAGTLDFWAQEGAAGRFYRPGPRGRMYTSTVHSVEPVSDDEVTVVVCTLKSLEVVDASGMPLSAEGGVAAGSVVAVRHDGVWLIRDLTRIGADVCPDPREQP